MDQHYIGVDLHKAFFQACAMSPSGARLWETRFDRTPDGIATFMTHCSSASQIAIEATGPTWHFVDAVQPSGARVCVVDTRKTRLKAGYAAKTDRLDARRLADALRRDSVVSIYIPPPPVRLMREICRSRHHLVRTRARVVQTIRALLLRVGHADPPMTRLTTAQGLAWLEAVTLGDAAATAVLRRFVEVVKAVDQEARAAEAVVREYAASDAIARALEAMVGVGPVFALTIRAEVGTIERFAHGAELASYAGLVPRVEASGGHVWHGRITREGSPWLRWALVEAAIHAMKREDEVGKWARRLALRKGMLIARVALARRLCTDVVRTWPRSA